MRTKQEIILEGVQLILMNQLQRAYILMTILTNDLL